MHRSLLPLAFSAMALSACVAAQDLKYVSKEGKPIMAVAQQIDQSCGVDLRAATVLDGINTNVLRVDLRSKDKTLDERVERARSVARYLKTHNLIPKGHYRISFDFPVSFQMGCMPVNLYDRVQLELGELRLIQALPAQRVMSYDQLIRGRMGQVVLDDTQWNIPFFLNVDRVELAPQVMGQAAGPDQVFVSVHAVWTNIGTQTATMGDDPWRLVTLKDGAAGARVAILDGGATHLARNGGSIKLPPVNPGASEQRWYVFRVDRKYLTGKVPLGFARQRFAKANAKDPWQKAGFEMLVPIKNAQPVASLPPPQSVLLAASEDWSTLTPHQEQAP